MNRKNQILDQIKMYSVLVGQQEDMLSTIEHLRKYDSHTDFTKQEAEIKRMIQENTAKIKAFQKQIEQLGD
jgi:hypothetical protein